jgi:hypothetical protein
MGQVIQFDGLSKATDPFSGYETSRMIEDPA